MDLELADRLNAKSPSMLRSESLDPLRQDMRARLWALQTQRRDIDSQISTLEEVIAVMDKQGR